MNFLERFCGRIKTYKIPAAADPTTDLRVDFIEPVFQSAHEPLHRIPRKGEGKGEGREGGKAYCCLRNEPAQQVPW